MYFRVWYIVLIVEKKLHINRGKGIDKSQEHLKCSTYSEDKNSCSAHFIRTCVLKEIIIGEINKLLEIVSEKDEQFINSAMKCSATKQESELKKAKNLLIQPKNELLNSTRYSNDFMRIIFQVKFLMRDFLYCQQIMNQSKSS